jgi:hypothetical protein
MLSSDWYLQRTLTYTVSVPFWPISFDPSHLYSPESVLITLLMEKLDSIHIGVVELPLYHENELIVGFASRTWHTNFSVTFSTTSRGFMFIILTLGESGIKKCASVHIQYNGKGSPKCNIIIYYGFSLLHIFSLVLQPWMSAYIWKTDRVYISVPKND